MIDPPGRQSMGASAFALPLSGSNAGKHVRQTLLPEGATRLTNEGPVETGMALNDSSLTPPSDNCTTTGVHETKIKLSSFGLDSETVGVREKASSAAFPASLELESEVVLASDRLKQVQPSSVSSEQQTYKSK